MSFPYTVNYGDTLTLIAHRHGQPTWKEIYYLPENAPFRAKRPNPNKIYPGDVVLIPGANPKTPPPAVLPHAPPPPAVLPHAEPAEPVSNTFAIRAEVEPADPRLNSFCDAEHAPRNFEVLDLVNGRTALFDFQHNPMVGDIYFAGDSPRGGRFRTFRTKRPLPLSGLSCKAYYTTWRLGPDGEPRFQSHMDLKLPGGVVRVAMRVHLLGQYLPQARTVGTEGPFELIKVLTPGEVALHRS